ncbi:hypothetical protein NE237_003557 [Protea cynaroides]|uniref:Uncharacterized protein n=1 Tax=Protea cynaroides TaxID=273540 RepID=A0A9Q0KGY4_9MAGN|nr:hypothetical protein NE237_003557 [Protea cynaroides]
MSIINQTDRSINEFKLKNVAIVGFTFAMIFNLIHNKFEGKEEDLFSNHKLCITFSMYLMLVAGCISTTIKLYFALLPAWAELALTRTSIICVFEALFMMSSIVLFDKDPPRAWFVLCIFPLIFFLSNPLKQLSDWGWFCFHWLRLEFEASGFLLLRIRGKLQAFNGRFLLRDQFFGRNIGQPNETTNQPNV